MLYAVLAVVLFTVAALVLDITALRQDRRSNRLTTDTAAAAGAAQLDDSGTRGQQACEDAWRYFLANRSDTSGTVTGANCSALNGICDPGSARAATGSAGGLDVTIVNPVPDGHEMMLGESPGGDRNQTSTVAHDGTSPCLRIGVSIHRARDLSFAGVAGFRSAETDVHSVARPDEPRPTGRAPALIVLDKTGCNALTTSNGGTLTAEEKLSAAGPSVPGVITVDSDGSGCGGSEWVIRPDRGGGIHAGSTANPGIIRSNAVLVGSLAAYDGGDYPSRLSPAPSAAAQVGHADVDSRYGTATSGGMGNLVAAVGGSGLPLLYNGFPFTPYIGPCAGLVPANIPFSRNLYVDCDVFEVPADTDVVFRDLIPGTSTIVFKGDVVVRDTGCLGINSNCTTGAAVTDNSIVYIRSGGLTKEPRGAVSLRRTLVALPSGGLSIAGGTAAVPGGRDGIRWSPHVGGPFDYLSLWAPTTAAITVADQSTGLNIAGLFFAPDTSGFVMRANPGGASTVDAQFIVKRFDLFGGTRGIVVGPDRTRAIQDTTRSVRLIR